MKKVHDAPLKLYVQSCTWSAYKLMEKEHDASPKKQLQSLTILKKGNLKFVTNYRPITYLPVFSKILKK